MGTTNFLLVVIGFILLSMLSLMQRGPGWQQSGQLARPCNGLVGDKWDRCFWGSPKDDALDVVSRGPRILP